MTNIHLVFNNNLINDVTSKFAVYFVNANGNEFGTNNAIIVEDITNTPMEGLILSNHIMYTFDYLNNTQGGRTPNTDAMIYIVCTGNNVKYNIITDTINNIGDMYISVYTEIEN
jgi:hypothetical protein